MPHTRYLFIDGAKYHFDASLKDFGRSLTHFRLLDPEEARLVCLHLTDGQSLPAQYVQVRHPCDFICSLEAGLYSGFLGSEEVREGLLSDPKGEICAGLTG